MRYDKVVKLYKNYKLSTGTFKYLVGCYRNDGSASAEESYLRRAEKEPVEVWYSTEVESASLYPDLVARWEREDAEKAERAKHIERYAIPLVSKPFPSMFANTYIQTADNARSVLNFARQLGFKRK
jgi:hypothetical protein